MIRRYEKAARRDQWHLLRTPTEYIKGGVAVAAFGEIVAAAGMPERGASLQRDGTLLALGAEVNFRTQEYHKADRQLIEFELEEGEPCANLQVRREDTKSRRTRIGVVRNPLALELLRRLMADGLSGPLLCNYHGVRLSKAGVYVAIRRTSLLGLGVPATSNLLRRSGASAETTAVAKAMRLGHSLTSKRTGLGVSAYTGSLAEEGRKIIKSSLMRYVPPPASRGYA